MRPEVHYSGATNTASASTSTARTSRPGAAERASRGLKLTVRYTNNYSEQFELARMEGLSSIRQPVVRRHTYGSRRKIPRFSLTGRRWLAGGKTNA